MNKALKGVMVGIATVILIMSIFMDMVKLDLGGIGDMLDDFEAFDVAVKSSGSHEIQPLDYYDYYDYGDALDDYTDAVEKYTRFSLLDGYAAIFFCIAFPALLLCISSILNICIGTKTCMPIVNFFVGIGMVALSVLATLLYLCGDFDIFGYNVFEIAPTIWFWIIVGLYVVYIILGYIDMDDYRSTVAHGGNSFNGGSSVYGEAPRSNYGQPRYGQPPQVPYGQPSYGQPQPRPYQPQRPFPQTPPRAMSGIKCISGEYAGAEFPCDGTLVIGRDSKISNIILTGEKVSRRHCTISFSPSEGKYVIIDSSTNGIFANPPGYRLPSNTAVKLPGGTTISIGSDNYRFLLM